MLKIRYYFTLFDIPFFPLLIEPWIPVPVQIIDVFPRVILVTFALLHVALNKIILICVFKQKEIKTWVKQPKVSHPWLTILQTCEFFINYIRIYLLMLLGIV